VEVKQKEKEHLVLELEDGWNADGKRAVLTNKRIFFTKKGRIISEINLKHIAKVYLDMSFLGVMSMKIRIFGDRIITTTFKCNGPKAILGSSYIQPKQKAITQRWVNAINRLLPK